jgi:tRNA A-37 threonylcarbamoyl transferase component Bud32
VREVGHGAMGIVYEAEQHGIGRRVAVKVLPPNLALRERTVKRFLREAEAMGRLAHPGIVDVFEVATQRELNYFSMKFVEGPPLDRVLKAGPLAVGDVLHIGIQVADALAHAHSRGVLHRDVKPANLLRDGDRVILTDFGLARPIDSEDGGSMTESGDLVGTPLYMAPRADQRATPSASTGAPTSGAWASRSTSCSPAALRSRVQTRRHPAHDPASRPAAPAQAARRRAARPRGGGLQVPREGHREALRDFGRAARGPRGSARWPRGERDTPAPVGPTRALGAPPSRRSRGDGCHRAHGRRALVLLARRLEEAARSVGPADTAQAERTVALDQRASFVVQKLETWARYEDRAHPRGSRGDFARSPSGRASPLSCAHSSWVSLRPARSRPHTPMLQRLAEWGPEPTGLERRRDELESRLVDLVEQIRIGDSPQVAADAIELLASWFRERGHDDERLLEYLDRMTAGSGSEARLFVRAAACAGQGRMSEALALHRERARLAPDSAVPLLDAAHLQRRMALESDSDLLDSEDREHLGQALQLLARAIELAVASDDKLALQRICSSVRAADSSLGTPAQRSQTSIRS